MVVIISCYVSQEVEGSIRYLRCRRGRM